MRKLLTVISGSAALLSLSFGVFAENLDAAAISTVHQQIKSAFVQKCKDNLKASDVICKCLSEKADKALNDSALGQCANDATGGPCITQAVTQAASAAMSQTAMDECSKLDPASAAAVSTPAPEPTVPATPDVTPADKE